MNDMNKHNLILSSEQLLVVHSRFLSLSQKKKNLIFAVGYALAAFFFISSGVFLFIKNQQPFFIFSLGIIESAITIFLTHKIVFASSVRHNSLVVSELGITLDSQNCATWNEIKYWSFRTYKGFERVGLSRKGEGTTIYVNTGDFDSRFHGAGRSIVTHFALRGIFFSEDQQVIWRRICTEKHIEEQK